MAAPNTLYIPQQLQGVAVEKGGSARVFIAADVFPPVNASKQDGYIYEIDPLRDIERDLDFSVPPGGEPMRQDVTVQSTLSYSCKKYATEQLVTDEERANAVAEAAPAIDAVRIARDRLLLARERKLVKALTDNMTTGTYTEAITDKWDNYTATTSPVDTILSKIKVISQRGFQVNSLAMDISVLRALANHPDMIDRAKYTVGPDAQVSNENVMAQLVARVFALDNVYVAKGTMTNSAAKGATASVAPVWGGNALLFYKEQPRLRTQNFGQHVLWTTGAAGAGGFVDGFRVQGFREERRQSDAYIVSHFYDQVLTNKDAGFLFTAAIS